MMDTTETPVNDVTPDNDALMAAIFRDNEGYREINEGQFWDTFSTHLEPVEGTYLYYAVVTAMALPIEPSWLMTFPNGDEYYGYILEKPLNAKQWERLEELSQTIMDHTPVIDWYGVRTHIAQWTPERRYSFGDIRKAIIDHDENVTALDLYNHVRAMNKYGFGPAN
jgi:hypothetical protein